MAALPMTSSLCLSAPRKADWLPDFLHGSGAPLLVFGGKGGTGKTTVAAATALHLARRFADQQVMAVSIAPSHALRDCFAGGPLPANLGVLEIDTRARLRAFKDTHARHLRHMAACSTFLDDEDLARLLDLSMPWLDELMAMDEIAALVEGGRYARVVVDTASAGHTLRFLELPRTLRKWLGALDSMLARHRYQAKLFGGSYRMDDGDLFLERVHSLINHVQPVLSDPDRCLFVPVMLAEPLSMNETRRLIARLEVMRVRVADVLVNRLHVPGGGCRACRAAHGRQRAVLGQLRREMPRHTLWEIPCYGPDVRGLGQLAGFWEGARAAAAAVPAARLSWEGPHVESPVPLPGPEVSLVVFAGKGGVGKTTLASATAVHLASRYPDRKCFLISSGPVHSLSACLGMAVGPAGASLGPNLAAVELEPERELAEMRKRYVAEVAESFDRSFPWQTQVDLEFEREAAERIIDLAPPGLGELMAIARCVSALKPGGRETIVLDTAPAGQLVRLLELPGPMADWIHVLAGLFVKHEDVPRPPGISSFLATMSRQVRLLRSRAADPARSRVHAVAAPTQTAVEETGDLIQACRRLGISVAALFLNQAARRGQCAECGARFRAEAKVRGRFRDKFTDLHQCVVYSCGDLQGIGRLTDLGRALYLG